jgi:hypothetical protein
MAPYSIEAASSNPGAVQDDELALNGILFVLRTGLPSQDLSRNLALAAA